jgi:hypothetical protein
MIRLTLVELTLFPVYNLLNNLIGLGSLSVLGLPKSLYHYRWHTSHCID